MNGMDLAVVGERDAADAERDVRGVALKDSQAWARHERLSLISLAGTLAGLCITIGALLYGANKSSTTVVDDVLAICAAGFVGCIYLTFWALQTTKSGRALLLIKCADVLFLSALTVMTLAGFIMVYEIW
jgi:hypothetical protein